MHRQRSTTAFSSASYYPMNGRPIHASAPACNEENNLLVCIGLQRHSWLICLLSRPTRPWLLSASTWWSSTPRWILTSLTYQVKSIQYVFILYIAFFKRAITPVCKLSHVGFKPVYITVNCGESQVNSLSRLETRGLIMTWLSKCCQYKGRQKIVGSRSGSRDISLPQSFEAPKSGSNIRLKVNLSLTKLLSSQIFGLQSGSMLIGLPQSSEALKSGLRISGSKRINFSQVRV